MTTIDTGIRRVTTLAGDPAWLVTRYDDVKALLADQRFGRSHPDPAHASRVSGSAIFGGPMGDDFAAEDAARVRMRRLLAPVFSARRMAALRPRVEAIVEELLDAMFSQDPPVDLHEAVSFPLPALVISELLGVPYADREDFRRWSDDAANMLDADRAQAGLLSLWEYMRGLVDAKLAQPEDDVLSLLLTTPHEGAVMSPDEVAMLGAGLLFAGHETTVTAIDGGTLRLLTNADQRAALGADPELLDGAVEEILRAALPTPTDEEEQRNGLMRYAREDVDFGGVTIEAGELVLLGLRSANRDAQRFPAPDRFDVTRLPNPHLTFGFGPRFCLGAPLARMELRALFGALLRRCPELTLAVPPEELRTRKELLTGGLEALPVTWPTGGSGT
jgi:pentalenolactone synthase